MGDYGVVHYVALAICALLAWGALKALWNKTISGLNGAIAVAPFLITAAVLGAFGTGSKFEFNFKEGEFGVIVSELQQRIQAQEQQIAELQTASPDATKVAALEQQLATQAQQLASLQSSMESLDPVAVAQQLRTVDAQAEAVGEFLTKFTKAVTVDQAGKLVATDPQGAKSVLDHGWKPVGIEQ